MNDKQYNDLVGEIRALATRWIDALGLRQWMIDFVWKREPGIITDENSTTVTFRSAEVSCSWRYMHASLTFFLPSVADYIDKEPIVDRGERLESLVLHELCHLLVNETRQDADRENHEERVVTQLANAFLWARNYWQADDKDEPSNDEPSTASVDNVRDTVLRGKCPCCSAVDCFCTEAV